MLRRPAFTLLELLLTLAIMAAIASVAIPQFARMLGDRRLARAAGLLQSEMTRLRVDAMRDGRVMMLEAMTEGGSVRIRPFYSLADATEAIDQTGSQSSLLSGATQGTVSTMLDQESDVTIELPENVIVSSVNVVSAARGSQIEQSISAEQTQGWSRPILFYPDGSTSTAAIVLKHETDGHRAVKIRGITGEVTVTEVLP